jgi:hypothetical protein
MTDRSVYDATIIRLPKIMDSRGNLTFIEGQLHIPFQISNVYWVYDVSGGKSRNYRGYRERQELIIALSGRFEVFLDDGRRQKIVSMHNAYYGLYIPNMIWRRLQNFSTNSIALVIS